MGRILLRRGGDLLFVSFGVSVMSFLMIRLIPGDAVQLMLGANAEVTQRQIDSLRHQLGLDQPFVEQYFVWLGRVLRGDFGTSLTTGRPVLTEIAAAAGVTAELTILGLLVAVLAAIPLGCAMAALRSPAASLAMRLLSITGITVPSFWLGIMLLYGVSVVAPGWALVGWRDLTADPAGNLQRVLLPAVSIALPVVASLARFLRAAMTDALQQDYVRTARAKGLGERVVLFRHALRNALIPLTTVLAIQIPALLAGTLVIETVFAWPGLGQMVYQAINDRDYPVILAVVMLSAALVVLFNLIADIVAALLDPRIRI
jgi:peptide/nickel transport system permease protein